VSGGHTAAAAADVDEDLGAELEFVRPSLAAPIAQHAQVRGTGLTWAEPGPAAFRV
jgi:hypothetical protein